MHFYETFFCIFLSILQSVIYCYLKRVCETKHFSFRQRETFKHLLDKEAKKFWWSFILESQKKNYFNTESSEKIGNDINANVILSFCNVLYKHYSIVDHNLELVTNTHVNNKNIYELLYCICWVGYQNVDTQIFV